LKQPLLNGGSPLRSSSTISGEVAVAIATVKPSVLSAMVDFDAKQRASPEDLFKDKDSDDVLGLGRTENEYDVEQFKVFFLKFLLQDRIDEGMNGFVIRLHNVVDFLLRQPNGNHASSADANNRGSCRQCDCVIS